MPRSARIVCPGIAHHVTQRGNRQQDIFLDDGDRRTYLGFLRHHSQIEQLRIFAYCLMTNHLHLVVVPHHEQSLARTIGSAHTRYAQYMNGKYSWNGHLFTSRYYSCPLDEVHLWTALRYVESNPVRAGIVKRPELWAWSSAPTHCGRLVDPMLDTSVMRDWPPKKWSRWLQQTDLKHENNLRMSTRTGRPLGSSGFIRKIERALKRTVTARKRGRPRTHST